MVFFSVSVIVIQTVALVGFVAIMFGQRREIIRMGEKYDSLWDKNYTLLDELRTAQAQRDEHMRTMAKSEELMQKYDHALDAAADALWPFIHKEPECTITTGN